MKSSEQQKIELRRAAIDIACRLGPSTAEKLVHDASVIQAYLVKGALPKMSKTKK